MPIFNKDLPTFNTPLEGFTEHEDIYKGKVLSDTLHPAVPNLNDEFRPSSTNLDVDDIFRMNTTQSGPIFGSTISELKNNSRYDFYKPGVNYEDIYARTQPWYKQIGNGLIKMGAFGVGTFAQSFASLPETISAFANQDLKELSGNDGYVAPIDDWMKSFEDTFPNYYSDYEKAHPFKSILGSGFSNFLGDKFAKNLGFMGGAIAGALVQDAAIGLVTEGLGEIPLLANQIGKASLYLNKLLSAESKVGRVLGATEKGILTSFLESGVKAGRTTEQLARMESLAQLAASRKINTQFRYGLNLWTSALTEGGVESRDGYRTLKQDLINQYKLENYGLDPTGKDLQDIEDVATSSMNARMVGNLGILMVSNAIMFENILKPFTSARAGLTSPIYQEIAGKRVALQDGLMGGYSEVVPKTILGKVAKNIKPYIPELISEGVYEEGGQYALEKGTYAYYNKKYLDQKNNKSRNDVAEFINALGEGLVNQFGTTAGLENMFIGALTAGVIGKGRSVIDNVKGVGSKAQVAAELNNLNSHQLTGIFQTNFENAAQQLQASKDMEAAVKEKDVFSYKNAQYKALFNYVNARIKGNRFGLLEEEIKLAKDLPDDQFKQMFGFDANADNRKVANEYLSLMQDEANRIKDNHDKINEFFSNPYKYIRTPKTDEEIAEQKNYNDYEDYKTAMTFFPSLMDHMDKREASIQKDLFNINPILSTNLVKRAGSSKSLMELADEYEKEAKDSLELISEYSTPQDRKSIENKAKILRKYSEDIYSLLKNLKDPSANISSDYLKLFNSVINFELNGRDASLKTTYIKHPLDVEKALMFSIDLNKIDEGRQDAAEAFNILSDPEKGFEEFRKVNENRLPPVHPEGSEISEGREYEIEKLGKYRIKKIDDDRYQIIGPDKSIISTHNNRKDALATSKYLNNNLNNLKKVKTIRDNGNGTVRIIDMNGDIQDIPKEDILKYTPLETLEEKLLKDKEDLDVQQDKVELNSGTIQTIETAIEIVPIEEGKLKSASKFFISGTSESETTENINKAPQHVRNSREFLNNAKNFKNRNELGVILVTANNAKALGLEGIVELQYGMPKDQISDLTNVDLGMVLQVFVERDGGKTYFVDKEGKRLGEVRTQIDVTKSIFQTMPTTELYYNYTDKNGQRVPKYRQGEKETFARYAKAWRIEREKLFNESTGKFKLYKFNISRGIPFENKINGLYERNQVGDLLIPENKISSQGNLVIINEEGFISHQLENITFPKGRPVLQYKDTLQALNNNKFGKEKANVIYNVFKALSEDILKQSALGKGITLDVNYLTYLQNVMYYRKSADTSGNQFFINTDNMTMYIGGVEYRISDIANKEQEIVKQLTETWHNINNKTIKDLSTKFYEYYMDANGNLQTRAWKNYQSYLLLSKTPTGSSRSTENTPLVCSVAKPTEAVPYAYKQKYATLIGLDLPIQSVPVQKEVVVAPVDKEKLGEFTMNNEKVNTFTGFTSGPVDFKGTIDDAGNITVDIVPNKTITDAAANDAMLKTIDAVLEQTGKYNAEDTPEQRVVTFVADKLLIELKKLQETTVVEEEPTPQPTAATFTPTTPYGTPTGPELTTASTAPVSDIEAKKADIEERRKDSLHIVTQVDLDKGEDVGITEEDGIFKGDYYNSDNVLVESYEGTLKEVQDKINAKYDAELAALEGGEQILPEEKTDKVNIDNTDFPEDDYMRVGVDDVSAPMTDAELTLFKQWHAEKTPGIPFEVLDNIITTYDNENAFGVFENGVAKFYKGAPGTTPYHEVGEGIWKAFLTPEQRQLILDEFKAKPGQFTDRATGKKIYYADATDQQAKERIWDDFAEFRAGKVKAKSLGEKIVAFFRNIIEFFKSFVQKPSMKEQLFKAIEAGKFKEFKVPEVVRADAPEYMRVPGLTETQANEYAQDMVIRAGQYIFGENKKYLFEIQKITGQEIYDNIKELYIKEKKFEELGEKRFNDLFKRAKDSLRTILGITINEDDLIDINDENVTSVGYAPEPFSVDYKKNSPYAVKLVLSIQPEVEPTNQQEDSTLTLPKRVISSVRGYKLSNFSRGFSTLLSKLSNTINIDRVVDKVADLAAYDATYVRFFKNIGGSYSVNDDKTISKYMNFGEFKYEDWRLFINFYQTFTKQNPTALIQYVSGNEVYTAPANQFTISKQVEQDWFSQMRAIAKTRKGMITYNSETKTYDVNTDSPLFPEVAPKTPQDMLEFLNNLGVTFTMEDYLKLKTEPQPGEQTDQRTAFSNAVGQIYAYLPQSKSIGTLDGKTLKINKQMSVLSGLQVKVDNPIQENILFGVDGNKKQIYTENNVPSYFESSFNDSQTIEQLKITRPELNDVFSKNSIILKKGGLFFNEEGDRFKMIKVSYIDGTKILDKNKGTTTSSLTKGKRFTQEINQNINGEYYILIPADGSTEWMMNLGNHINFNEIKGGRAWEDIHEIFKGYLMDDIALARDYKTRQNIKNVGKRAKELRFFNDMLSEYAPEQLEDITELIESGSQEEIDKYLSDKDNIDAINNAVTKTINSLVEGTKEILLQTGEVNYTSNKSSEEVRYSYKQLDSNFANSIGVNKYDMSEEDFNNIITFVNTNNYINNIELHKILFGDPLQFNTDKGKLDEPKRVKSFLSPRRTTFNHPEFNTYLNSLNEVNDILLTEDDYGYHENKDYLETVTIDDIEIDTTNYEKVNEADAFSWLADGAYREIKYKNGQWPTVAEQWHQWQMAYTRSTLANRGDYIYSNKALKIADEKMMQQEEPKFVVDVLKPIATGVKYNQNFIDLNLDKTSQMPIYFKAVEGTNLEKLYIKMFKEKIDYAIVKSGRKVGIEKMHSFYKDGEFNEEPFAENTKVKVPFSIYGIQVETAYQGGTEQTRGSQPTKISSLDMFENGEEIIPGAKQEFERYTKTLNLLHENAYNELLNDFGVEDLGLGDFKLVDNSLISKTLENELFRRALSNNAKETIRLTEDGQFMIPFEASPAYNQIKDIVYSMINKALISPKVSGGGYVQTAVTGWENAKKGRGLAIKTEEGYKKISKADYLKLSDSEKAKVTLTSDTLKFPTKEDPYLEVLIPCWFKDKLKGRFESDKEILEYLNTSEGKKILTGIGFRIPAQGMSSMDAVRVKGFLPEFMGKTVVVPSEITTKAGSDFDIDKLNMYLKSIYLDEKGNIKLVEYKGSEKETKDFYSKVYDATIKAEINNISNGDEFRENLYKVLSSLENPDMVMSKEQRIFYKINENIINAIVDQADSAEMLPSEYILNQISSLSSKEIKLNEKLLNEEMKDKFVKNMYKRSLENEYFDSFEKLITLKGNFERLITPIDDAGLKDAAEELDKLRKYDESKIINKVVNRNFLTNLRHAFVTGKKWVGIVAVNITGHADAQKTKLVLDVEKVYDDLPQLDQKILFDSRIKLPHNTTTLNNKQLSTLSGSKTKDGKNQYISYRLSGYATAVVDISKDPFIMKIIRSTQMLSTAMFLERLGVGENTVWFLNQPIIQEYISYLENLGTTYLYNQDNINNVVSRFDGTQGFKLGDTTGGTFSVDDLKKNINDYHTLEGLSPEQNQEQEFILHEFLKYAKMAEYSFNLTQASNYDTTKFKNSDVFHRKTIKTKIARNTNIFSSVDNILNSGFKGKQLKFIYFAMNSVGSFIKLEQERFTDITNRVLRAFEEKQFMSDDDFAKVARKIKSSFLDYIIQTKSGINSEISNLVIGDNSIAEQLAKAKMKYPEMKLLQDLVPVESKIPGGAQSVKLKVNLKEAHDENLYTEMMRELKELEPELYNNLVKIALLQGSYQTPISINNIIPIEDYSKEIKPIIDTLTVSPDLEYFANGMFQKNNWKDETIVPTSIPRFFYLRDKQRNILDEAISEDVYGNDIYQYQSPMFPAIPELGIQPSDVRILTLSPIYDGNNGVDSDFVKVPKIITNDFGQKINITTGQTISDRAIAATRASGDLSLDQVFGYQKVKYSDGSPVTNEKGHHVYKLVNLLGDGNIVSEYYLDGRPSVLNNGTIKIDQEIADARIIEYFGGKVEEEVVSLPTEVEDMTNPQYQGKEEFNKLPGKSITPTMTYAGIGSRETPKEVMDQMTELAKELESRGYTLRSGGAQGADTAFETGVTSKKEIFPGGQKAGEREMKIAREIHPNPQALDNSKNPSFVWNLMARNTNQVFGKNLDTPVDFVIAYTQDGLTDYTKRSIKSGGTGQAIDMASRKGIPVINLANPNWRQELDRVLSLPTEEEIISTEEIKPGQQLNLFEQEDDSWKEEDNNDSCVPF